MAWAQSGRRSLILVRLSAP